MRRTRRRSAETTQHQHRGRGDNKTPHLSLQKIWPVPRPVGTYTALASIPPKAAGLKPFAATRPPPSFGLSAVQAFPLSDVNAMIGHADISTTMRYVHHVPQDDAADRLSKLVGEAQSDALAA
jgi:integrase